MYIYVYECIVVYKYTHDIAAYRFIILAFFHMRVYVMIILQVIQHGGFWPPVYHWK